jgi:hypothetical protein
VREESGRDRGFPFPEFPLPMIAIAMLLCSLATVQLDCGAAGGPSLRYTTTREGEYAAGQQQRHASRIEESGAEEGAGEKAPAFVGIVSTSRCYVLRSSPRRRIRARRQIIP